MAWTGEEKKRVAEEIVLTADSIPTVCERLGIKECEDMEDLLLDEGIECCAACGWWFESQDPHFVGNDVYCEDCKEDGS